MVMRIDVDFPKPLTAEDRTAAQLAIATLAKSERIVFSANGYSAVVYGIGMSIERVRESFDEMGVAVEQIHSSLNDEENAEADDVESGSTKERFRPIGR